MLHGSYKWIIMHENFGPIYEVNGLDWQFYLAGRILIFSIAIGVDYSYKVKNSEI